MPPHTPALVALLLLTSTASAGAQTLVRASTEIARASVMRAGRIEGIVRDQTGQVVSGARIVAMGESIASARSDAMGRFSLVLQPGEYVLRATRDGYVSTYREAVQVRSSAVLDREITMTRPGVPDTPAVVQAGFGEITSVVREPAVAGPSAHSHTEAAWRLRHLPRTVLRDGSDITALFSESDTPTLVPAGSLFDRAMGRSAQLASSLFRDTDFTGQVNFITTSMLDVSSSWLPETWPRSIAYFSIGAAAGPRGDWQMRGSIGGGDRASWALVGEYQSPADASHSLRAGVSYSAQGYLPAREDRLSAALPAARSVAGVYAFDHWSTSGFELDYGLRLDRYDYIATPQLFSPRMEGRMRLFGRLFAAGSLSQRMIAPGFDEFLPPSMPGPWLPPERTFSSLLAGAPLRAERIRHVDLSVGRQFGPADRPRHVSVRRIRQVAEDQIATLFGLDEASGIGHYYVATPGTVSLDAWSFSAGGSLTRRIDASVEYAIADAGWDRRSYLARLRRAAPSVVRRQHERLQDLTAIVQASVKETSTRVTFVYRVNSAFSADDRGRLPVADGRFDLTVHQALPYQPIRGGRLEVLVAARTLFRELAPGGSFYDELLTVRPPLRLVGGVQVRF